MAEQTGSTPEEFFRPLGIFSGIKEGIAIGRWGNGTTIFDVAAGEVYKVIKDGPSYRILFLGCAGRFQAGEGAIGEVLFGSSWMWAAFGGPQVDLYSLSSEEIEALFVQLRAQGIEPEDYLV